MKLFIGKMVFLLIFFTGYFEASGRDILFCGEKIPVSNDFVSKKLMDVIRKQIPNVNLPELRRNAKQYFGVVEAYLRATGLPDDFKYLAIVESGFKNVVSPKGAAGFWQLMEATAEGYGLKVNEYIDERNDIYKSTYVACRQLADYYNGIAHQFKIYSWVLTAAAYNFGINNMSKAIRKQGTDYFQMELNNETANYVYKIIAVKELWEYPELYMKDFGYNLFSPIATGSKKISENNSNADGVNFSSMEVSVNEKSGKYPKEIKVKEISKNENIANSATQNPPLEASKIIRYIQAKVVGKYKKFKDGDIVSFTLESDLQVGNRFTGKENIIQGIGWVIDNRVVVDLGYEHSVIVCDQLDNKKGLILSSLKNKEAVLLKIINSGD